MKELSAPWFGTVLTVATTVISTEVRDIISWIISLVVGILTIAFTVYTWVKKAKADGKITKEEIEELREELFNINNEEGDK